MTRDFRHLLAAGCSLSGPAPAQAIDALRAASPKPLPEAYLDLLRWANGGEGFIKERYVSFWSAEEVLQLNEDYGISEWVPGLIAFGSDGGGEAYLFDFRREGPPIVELPFGDLDYDSVRDVAPDFARFIGGG